jgi:hypothetical protein
MFIFEIIDPSFVGKTVSDFAKAFNFFLLGFGDNPS